jgi:hypothetical protein
MPASNNVLARVRSLAKRGWDAYGLLSKQVNPYLDMTVSAEAANVITLTGQVRDQLGNALKGAKVVSFTVPFDATPSTTYAVTTGTALVGAASATMVIETDANGKFVVTVTNAAAESIAVEVRADNCAPLLKKLTFA